MLYKTQSVLARVAARGCISLIGSPKGAKQDSPGQSESASAALGWRIRPIASPVWAIQSPPIWVALPELDLCVHSSQGAALGCLDVAFQAFRDKIRNTPESEMRSPVGGVSQTAVVAAAACGGPYTGTR